MEKIKIKNNMANTLQETIDDVLYEYRDLIKNDDEHSSISIKSNTGRMVQRCDCSQSCGEILCTMGLGGNERFIVEKVLSAPPEERILRFKPRAYKSDIFDGVSLSMLQ